MNNTRFPAQSTPAEITCPCGQTYTIAISPTAQDHHQCFSPALSAVLDQILIVEEELTVLRRLAEEIAL